MYAAQMRDLLESYPKLKRGLETSKANIRRINSFTFGSYIEEKTHRCMLGETRLASDKSSNPTETLGLYGRSRFEQERDHQLRNEHCRLAARQALLWQLDVLIDRLGASEKELIVQRFIQRRRVDDLYKAMGVSRATAFRRLESGVVRLAKMYTEMYEQAS